MTVEELQDEICAIDAIFPNCSRELSPQIFEFKVPQHEKLLIQMSFSTDYPDTPPNIIQVFTTNANKYTDINYLEKSFLDTLKSIFHVGEVCLFEFFSELEQTLEVYNEKEAAEMEAAAEVVKEAKDINPSRYIQEGDTNEPGHEELEIDPFEGWIQSEVIEDRGSKFLGFAREVHSVEEAKQYLDQLLTDRKIQRATHNMTSWRIKKENGVQFQDCDDDGETAAGGRILHLLTVRIRHTGTFTN